MRSSRGIPTAVGRPRDVAYPTVRRWREREPRRSGASERPPNWREPPPIRRNQPERSDGAERACPTERSEGGTRERLRRTLGL